ncbi:MAG: efflux RND transporter periplasmic adaptor subunit [Bacteroidaceae bacterium]|nr:efflux RND transporter periplasmic adaptor subunit [Bacteroidaceae bacterium]
MKKNISAALLLAAALMVSSCGGDKKDAAKSEEKPQVKVETAKLQSIPQTETYSATVESDVKNNISPNAPLRIEKIYVDVGDVVRKGQVLVQLDASNLRQNKLQVENMKLQLENVKTEFNRTNALFQVGGASQAEYDNAKLALDNARMQLNVFETQYRQLVQNTQLTAPISGVVTARHYDNGDMYGAQPILTIEQTNPVKLLVNISETYYKQMKKGMPVDITLDAYPGENFYGRVTTVYPSVDVATHTFPVEVTINNSSQRVRPGMYARATVNFGDKQHVVVPDAAVVKQIGAGDRFVYVYKNGKVSYNKVELGQHIGDLYEILSGVENGDQVVTAGQARLANGREVEIIK